MARSSREERKRHLTKRDTVTDDDGLSSNRLLRPGWSAVAYLQPPKAVLGRLVATVRQCFLCTDYLKRSPERARCPCEDSNSHRVYVSRRKTHTWRCNRCWPVRKEKKQECSSQVNTYFLSSLIFFLVMCIRRVRISFFRDDEFTICSFKSHSSALWYCAFFTTALGRNSRHFTVWFTRRDSVRLPVFINL